VSRTSYPSTSDLTALLTSYGLTLDAGQVAGAVLAGIESFESAVDRHMLAGKATDNTAQGAVTRTYLPPDNVYGILDLAGDLAAAPTVTYQPHGAAAEAFTLLTDYRLDPENAPAEGRPYERLQFHRRWYAPGLWSFGSALQVTGTWGYGATIPEDAWRAMLHGGLLWLVGQAWGAGTVPLKSWKEADAEEEYAVPSWADRQQALQMDIAAAVHRYRKVSLGM
jgi:hypothetical protein